LFRINNLSSYNSFKETWNEWKSGLQETFNGKKRLSEDKKHYQIISALEDEKVGLKKIYGNVLIPFAKF
jgi:hypothetical protein